MNQQSLPNTDPQSQQHGIIPIVATFDPRSAAYSLHSIRSTLPVADLGAFPLRRTSVSRTLRVFSTLYSRLGIAGPFVIRMLALILHRFLKQSIIPAELVALARYPVLFDRTFYLQQLRDAQQPMPGDALYHYLTIGDVHNICPNPLFNPSLYRRSNMLPSEATQNTLVHYIEGVWHGSGVTCYMFHSRWYMEQNEDVVKAGINPLAHYLKDGYREHRNPSVVMDLGNYWTCTPQLSKSEDPAQHYMLGGFRFYPHTDEKLNILSEIPFPYDVSREFQHFSTHAVLPQTTEQRRDQQVSLSRMIAGCTAIQNNSPIVTVIIPAYNKLTYTINAIESILQSETRTPFEIVIVDDQSTDETAQFFVDLAPIRIHTQKTDQGYIAACNQGAILARGTYILFLHNDVYVLPQWLDAMVDTFGQLPNVGLVGSQLLYPDGLLQSAGGIVEQNGVVWNYGRGEYPMLPTYAHARSVNYCSGASIMMQKTLFERVGMFSEAFNPASYVDADLGMTVRAAGYDVIYQPGSKVVHFEGVSSDRDVEARVKIYQERNHALFAEKWSVLLPSVRNYGGSPRTERLIPIASTYRATHANYALHSLRASLPVTDIDAFPHQSSTSHPNLRFFAMLYVGLGALGPFVIRMLSIIFHRILNTNFIPAEVRAIARYPQLFDVEFYREQLTQQTIATHSNLFFHYLTIGDAHNLCPNPLFDPAIYRRYNMLPTEATQNTLCHYIAGVWHGSGVTSYVFHSRWYLQQNQDVASTGINPLAHYMKAGYRERRDPSVVMNLGNYWARTTHLAKQADPAQDYIKGGFRHYPHADEMLNMLSDMPFPYDVSREFQYFATHAGLPQTTSQRSAQQASLRDKIAHCDALNPGSPRVTVIIPVYNQLTYTINAIESILLSDPRTPFEIVVIDDLSTDETAQFFADLAPIRIHTQATNQGFIAACNQGAALARGEYLLFLNNDVYVLPQWLDALFDTFGQIPNVGLVGSQLLYPDGLLQEAGGIVWQNGEGWNYGRGEYPMLPEYTYARSVDYCSGASIMIRASLFATVGMFPEAFKPAYYEDTDLGMAVRAAGYDVIYQPASKIVHFEGVSSGRDVRSGVKSYQMRNQQLFAEKWQEQLRTRRPYGDTPAVAAVYWYAGHTFFADASYPTPDQDAGSQVADSWMRMFRRLGYHVTFLPVDNFIGVSKYTKRLEALGVYCPRRPYEEDLKGFFSHPVQPFAFGVFHRYDRARRVYDILDMLAIDFPRLFIPADLHHLRDLRQAVLTGSMTDILGSFKTKYEEYAVMAQSTLICVHSNYERDEINTTIPQLDVEVSPIIYDVPGRTRGYHERADVLFVGGFRHPPNVDGMLFFVHDVWPLVLREIPDLVLHVVGSNITPEITQLAAPSVRIHGFVEDLTPMLDTVKLTLAPLRYGAGVKGKVTMSMCNGIPVVGTTVAFEGMSLTHGTEMLRGDSAVDLARHIITAYRDEAVWYRLSDGAVARAQAEYSLESNIPLIERFIAKAVAAKPTSVSTP